MIPYKQIELSDRETIMKCLDGNSFRACDFSFTNLISWNPKFKTKYYVTENTLFLRFIDGNNEVFYMMPIGSMDLAKAISLMEKDAKENSIPFQMKAISNHMWQMIDQTLPGKFHYLDDRDNYEYIYSSEKLINLSGKKLQSKRNHINRFKADNPNWEYISVTNKETLEECRNMLNEWENIKENQQDKESLKYDSLATRFMIDHFATLNLKGGAIKIDGKMIAFTIGEKLTDDTFVVHVEKAFSHINGAYTIINQQFIKNEASEFAYINREEDMGLEPLRKAKKSYYPDILLEEGIVKPLN